MNKVAGNFFLRKILEINKGFFSKNLETIIVPGKFEPL